MKAKFNKLDRSKLSKEVNSILDKIKKATDNFKKEDKKAEALFDRLYDKIKEGKPEAIKSTKKPSKTKKKKSSGGNRGVFVKLAKSIRDAKPSMTWNEALKEASKKLKADKEKANKKFASSIQTIIDANKKYFGSKTASSLEKDAKQPAKPIGKRRSKKGKTYYEYRTNRTDVKQPPKSFPMLEKGGNVDLFENYETLPKKVRDTIDFYMEKYQDGDYTYEDSKNFLEEMQKQGYTFEYGLDNEPYDLRKMAKGGKVEFITTKYTNKRLGYSDNDYKAIVPYKNKVYIVQMGGLWNDYNLSFEEMLINDEDGNLVDKRIARAVFRKMLKEKPSTPPKPIKEIKFAKGGKIGFEGLAKKVAKNYEGKKVKPKFQDEYGKTYDKEEAMQVGRAVAGKVLKQQNMKKMEDGGIVREENIAYQGGLNYGTTRTIAPQFGHGGNVNRGSFNVTITMKDGRSADILPIDVSEEDAQDIADMINNMKPMSAKADMPLPFEDGGAVTDDYYARGGNVEVGDTILKVNEDDISKVFDMGYEGGIQEYLDDLNKKGLGYAEYDERQQEIYTNSKSILNELENEGIGFKTYGFAKGGMIDGKKILTYVKVLENKGKLEKGDILPVIKINSNRYDVDYSVVVHFRGKNYTLILQDEMRGVSGEAEFTGYEPFAKGGKIDTSKKGVYVYELKDGTFKVANNFDGRDFPYEFADVFPTKERAMKFADKVAKNSKSKVQVIKFEKGGKTQGYNARLDESLGNRRGRESTKQQSKKDRRDESKGMEKGSGRRAYSSVSTMDVGDRKMAKGGKIDKYVAITLKPKKRAYKGGKGEVYKNMQTFYDTINAKENEDKYDFIHSLFISDSRKSDPQDISEIKVYMIGEKSGFDDVEKKGLYDFFDLVKTKEEVKDYAKGGKVKAKKEIVEGLEELEVGLAGASKKHKQQSKLAKQIKDGFESSFEKGGNVPKRFLDEKGERKNDPETIEELTEYVMSLPQTKSKHYNKVTKKYSARRQKLHRKIINEFKDELVCIERDEPIAILMGGSPASGKSTFLRKYAPYLLKEELLRIDADEVRAMLPEYKGWNASATHNETQDIVKTLLSDRTIGIPCKYDVIFDGTMTSPKKYLDLIRLLKKLGYKVFVVFIDKVPKDVIMKRAMDRYKKSGRFVPPFVIEEFFETGKDSLAKVKAKVDGYMIVDGSNNNYKVIEQKGLKLPKTRKYSRLGVPLKRKVVKKK